MGGGTELCLAGEHCQWHLEPLYQGHSVGQEGKSQSVDSTVISLSFADPAIYETSDLCHSTSRSSSRDYENGNGLPLAAVTLVDNRRCPLSFFWEKLRTNVK